MPNGQNMHIHETENEATNTNETPNKQPIALEELNASIKQLKRGKSMGPDLISNEAFIEADDKTRQILLMTLNQIHK